MTTKTPLVDDGEGRALALVLTGGQAADTTMLPDTLDELRVTGATGRARQRPDRLLAYKGYPSRANRAWLHERGIATTIPERTNRTPTRRKRPGRPTDFGDEQRQRYRGRNVVERCFNHHSGQCLAAALHWVQTFSDTA